MRKRIEYDPVMAADSRATARLFGVPHYILAAWQLEGFVGRNVVTPEQWNALDMIRCVVWQDRNAIRSMLGALPRAERWRLVEGCKKTSIERVVFFDFLRFRLTGRGIMGDDRPVTYERYQKYVDWRHPKTCHLLTRAVFDRQRKAAEGRIRYVREHGELDRLIYSLGLLRLEGGRVINPWLQPAAGAGDCRDDHNRK